MNNPLLYGQGTLAELPGCAKTLRCAPQLPPLWSPRIVDP
jgi:hypothetical protein